MKMKIYDSNWYLLADAARTHCGTDYWKLVKIRTRFFGSGYVAVLKKPRD